MNGSHYYARPGGWYVQPYTPAPLRSYAPNWSSDYAPEIQCWRNGDYSHPGYWYDCTPRPQTPKASSAAPPPAAAAPAAPPPAVTAGPAATDSIPRPPNSIPTPASHETTAAKSATTTGQAPAVGPAKPKADALSWETVLLVAGAIAGAALLPRLVVAHALVTHSAREWVEKTITDLKAAQAEAAQHREFARYERMSQKTFDAEQKRDDDQITRLATRADRLLDQAERAESSRFQIPVWSAWRIRYLRRQGNKAAELGHALADELERIGQLWVEISAARETKMRDKQLAEVRCLLGLVGSSSNAAVAVALAKLNRYKDIDWIELIPHDMPQPARVQASKLCALIAGNSNIHEARAAFVKLQQLFKANGISF